MRRLLTIATLIIQVVFVSSALLSPTVSAQGSTSIPAGCPGSALPGPPAPGTTCPSSLVVTTEDCDFSSLSVLGVPVWYKYLKGEKEIIVFEDVQPDPEDIPCQPVVNNAEDFLPIGLAVLEMGMTIAGMVAVVMVFWGAFNFVLTQGEPDKAASARKTVINAAIGLAIIIVATRVVSFIANTLTN